MASEATSRGSGLSVPLSGAPPGTAASGDTGGGPVDGRSGGESGRRLDHTHDGDATLQLVGTPDHDTYAAAAGLEDEDEPDAPKGRRRRRGRTAGPRRTKSSPGLSGAGSPVKVIRGINDAATPSNVLSEKAMSQLLVGAEADATVVVLTVDANEEVRPPDLSLNVRAAGHVCEIKMMLQPMMMIKKEQHKFYKISRLDGDFEGVLEPLFRLKAGQEVASPQPEALVPACAPAPATLASPGTAAGGPDRDGAQGTDGGAFALGRGSFAAAVAEYAAEATGAPANTGREDASAFQAHEDELQADSDLSLASMMADLSRSIVNNHARQRVLQLQSDILQSFLKGELGACEVLFEQLEWVAEDEEQRLRDMSAEVIQGYRQIEGTGPTSGWQRLVALSMANPPQGRDGVAHDFDPASAEELSDEQLIKALLAQATWLRPVFEKTLLNIERAMNTAKTGQELATMLGFEFSKLAPDAQALFNGIGSLITFDPDDTGATYVVHLRVAGVKSKERAEAKVAQKVQAHREASGGDAELKTRAPLCCLLDCLRASFVGGEPATLVLLHRILVLVFGFENIVRMKNGYRTRNAKLEEDMQGSLAVTGRSVPELRTALARVAAFAAAVRNDAGSTQRQEKSVGRELKILAEVAEKAPGSLRVPLLNLMEQLTTIAAAAQLEDDTKRCAVEVLLPAIHANAANDNDLNNSFFSRWGRCANQTQSDMKAALLHWLQARDTSDAVRRAISGAISQMAQFIVTAAVEFGDSHPWPELLTALWQCARNEIPSLREEALLILAEAPLVFGNQLDTNLIEVSRLLQERLADAEIKVRAAAARAFTGFVLILESNEKRAPFVNLTAPVLQAIGQACEAEIAPKAQSSLKAIIELAEILPKFFRPSMPMVIERMFNIANEGQLEDGTRRMAIEVLLVLAEEAPSMSRKFPDLVVKLAPLLIQFCAEIEDDPEWSKQDEDDLTNEDLNSTVGEQSLDRLSCALGGGAVFPQVFTQLEALFGDQANWRGRAAALSTVAAIAEGCLENMRGVLGEIVEHVAPCLVDPHPRVRYAACNAVGQLSLDFAPARGKEHKQSFQTLFHGKVIPALLAMMEDQENPRVQAHGAAALVNFCEHAHKETLGPYLDVILARLGEMLASPFRIVLEQTVTAIATVADSSEQLFQNYYSAMMPRLKAILAAEAAPDQAIKYRLLRGKTIECISLIGIAVGKAVFSADAEAVMQLLRGEQLQVAPMDSNDPRKSYLLAAWARMCEIQGQDFLPLLPVVMPPLLRSVRLEAKLLFLEPEEDVDELDGGAGAWEVIGVSAKRIAINTSVLEEKKTACDMLKIYVKQLKAGFGPYIAEVAKIMIGGQSFMTSGEGRGLVDFIFDESVRSTAAGTLPHLLVAAQECDALRPAPLFGANQPAATSNGTVGAATGAPDLPGFTAFTGFGAAGPSAKGPLAGGEMPAAPRLNFASADGKSAPLLTGFALGGNKSAAAANGEAPAPTTGFPLENNAAATNGKASWFKPFNSTRELGGSSLGGSMPAVAADGNAPAGLSLTATAGNRKMASPAFSFQTPNPAGDGSTMPVAASTVSSPFAIKSFGTALPPFTSNVNVPHRSVPFTSSFGGGGGGNSSFMGGKGFGAGIPPFGTSSGFGGATTGIQHGGPAPTFGGFGGGSFSFSSRAQTARAGSVASMPALWERFSTALLKAAMEETEFEVLSWQIEAIKECIDVVGRAHLRPAFQTSLTQATMSWLSDYDGRYQERRELSKDEDFDFGAVAKLQKDEQLDVQVLQEISHLQHALFSKLTTDYLPFFNELVGAFQVLLSPDRGPADRQWALCVFGDLVEACGPAAAPYTEKFVPAMLQYTQDANAHVRQAAAYGCGAMALCGGAPFEQFLPEAYQKLMQAVQAPDARAFGNLEATENAISAIAKLTSNPTVGVSMEQSLPTLLGWLPLTEDPEEAMYIYNYLCDLVVSNDPVMAQERHLVKFVSIMADEQGGLGTPVCEIDSVVGAKVKGALMQMQSRDQPKVQRLMAQLPPTQQRRLHSVLPELQAPLDPDRPFGFGFSAPPPPGDRSFAPPAPTGAAQTTLTFGFENPSLLDAPAQPHVNIQAAPAAAAHPPPGPQGENSVGSAAGVEDAFDGFNVVDVWL